MIGERFDQSNEASWRVLQSAARLLLEYNERSALIKQQLERLAARLARRSRAKGARLSTTAEV